MRAENGTKISQGATKALVFPSVVFIAAHTLFVALALMIGAGH